MFRNIILNILKEIYPMMIICCILIIITRLIYIKKSKKEFILYKELIYLGFMIYMMLLFRIVTFQDVNYSDFNIIPFKEMFRYEIGSKLFFKNVVGNMLMFIPYGFFISYILKENTPWSIIILSLFASFTIEITQYRIGRVFDIDDIMLNLIGGFLGYILYFIILKIKDKLPNSLQKISVYNIIVLLIVILILLYLMGVFYVWNRKFNWRKNNWIRNNK